MSHLKSEKCQVIFSWEKLRSSITQGLKTSSFFFSPVKFLIENIMQDKRGAQKEGAYTLTTLDGCIIG